MTNKNLTNAKNAKNDEFYTMLSDIENELKYYRDQFKGKVVLCNCDDPYESNFFKYFAMNFNLLGLKKLISTCYDGSCISYVDLLADVDESAVKERKAYKVEITKVYDANGDGGTDLRDVKKLIEMGENKLTLLKGNGDFASEECLEILKEADIVVTNPPFSKFRDYVKVLMDYNKKFLIMGNGNAVTYKEIFPYIKDGELWLGRTLFTGKMPYFKVPDNYNVENDRVEYRKDGIYKQVNSIAWFTNMPNDKRKYPLSICKKYSGYENEYPHYDNYDAINIDKMTDMPYDLPIGQAVGIPITGLKYLCDDGLIYFDDCGMSEQLQKYEVEKFRKGDDDKDLVYSTVNGGGGSQEYSLTSESLSSVSDNCPNGKYECGREQFGISICKQKEEICKNSYQAYKIIGGYNYSKDIFGNTWNGLINGKYVYKRILIQRIK